MVTWSQTLTIGGYKQSAEASMDRLKALDIFNESYSRCLSNPSFLDLFYEKFLASSPAIRAKFEGTDFDQQKKHLQLSLSFLRMATTDYEADRYLRRVAVVHNKRNRDIPPLLYDLWFNCMMETVEICDYQYSPDVEEAWAQALKIGIRYIVSKYDEDEHPESSSGNGDLARASR